MMLTFADALKILEETIGSAKQSGVEISMPLVLMAARAYLETRPQDQMLDDFDGNIVSRFFLTGFKVDEVQNNARFQVAFRIFKVFFELENDEEACEIFEYLGQKLLPIKAFTPKHFDALCNVARKGQLLFLVDSFKMLQALDFSEGEILALTKAYGKNPDLLSLHYQLYDSLIKYAPEVRYLGHIAGYPTVVKQHKNLLTPAVLQAITRSQSIEALSVLVELVEIFGKARFLGKKMLQNLLAIESVAGMQYLKLALQLAEEHLLSQQDCLLITHFVAENLLDIPLLQKFTAHDSNAFFSLLIQEDRAQVETFLTCLKIFSDLEGLSAQIVFNELHSLFTGCCKAYSDYQYLPEVIHKMLDAGFKDANELMSFLSSFTHQHDRPMLNLKNILCDLTNSESVFDSAFIHCILDHNPSKVRQYIEVLKRCNLQRSKDCIQHGLNFSPQVFECGTEYLSSLINAAPNFFCYLDESESFRIMRHLFDAQKQRGLVEFQPALAWLKKIINSINLANQSELSEVMMLGQANFFNRQLAKLISQNTDWEKIRFSLYRLNRRAVFSANNFCQIFACLTSPQSALAHQAIGMLREADLLTEEYFFAFYEYLFRNDCLEKNIAVPLEPVSHSWMKTWSRLQREPNLSILIRSYITQEEIEAFREYGRHNDINKLKQFVYYGLIHPEQLRYEMKLYLEDFMIQDGQEPPVELLSFYIECCFPKIEKKLAEKTLEAPTIHLCCQQFVDWMRPVHRFVKSHDLEVQTVLHEVVFELTTKILDCSERIRQHSVGADELLRCQALLLLQFANYFSNAFAKVIDEEEQEKRLLDVMAQDSDEEMIILQQQIIAELVLHEPWVRGFDFEHLLEAPQNHQNFKQLICRLVETSVQNEKFIVPEQPVIKTANNDFSFFTKASCSSKNMPHMPILPQITRNVSLSSVF